MSHRPIDEQLTGVLARLQHAGLSGAHAETTAFDVLLRFHHRTGPAWLLRADDRTRLDVLTALALVRARDGARATEPR